MEGKLCAVKIEKCVVSIQNWEILCDSCHPTFYTRSQIVSV